jgi:hypothetical protein
MTVDCRDGRFATSFYGIHTLLALEDRFSQCLPNICTDSSTQKRSKLREVKTRRETFSFCFDHHNMDTRIFVKPLKMSRELFEKSKAHGIPIIRPIQRQPNDMTILLDFERILLTHLAPLFPFPLAEAFFSRTVRFKDLLS